MNNLNLVKLLKECEGTTIWSDIHGECFLERITDGSFPIVLAKNDHSRFTFMKDGRVSNYPDGKCMIWPSRECRDWNKFKKSTNLKEGDWVVCYSRYPSFYIRKYKSNGLCYNPSTNEDYSWPYVIPFKDFDPNLSKEELENLSIV